MSEDRKEAAENLIDRIQYLIGTDPVNLQFSPKEKRLLYHLHEHFDGSWVRLVAAIEDQRDSADSNKRWEYEHTLTLIGWMKDYESIYQVRLSELYVNGATKTS